MAEDGADAPRLSGAVRLVGAIGMFVETPSGRVGQIVARDPFEGRSEQTAWLVKFAPGVIGGFVDSELIARS